MLNRHDGRVNLFYAPNHHNVCVCVRARARVM